jgi:2-C-methyl-D-erythritol 4-phosphate cytidylyltransferase
MSKIAAVLLAAGRSSRFENRDKKPFADLDGRAVWLRSLELFAVRDDVVQILVVIAEEDQELFDRRYRSNVAFLDNAKVVFGGAERTDSVRNALAQVRPEVDLVAIHDTARACLTAELLTKVLEAGAQTGAATLAAPVADTIKRAAADRTVSETVSRDNLWLVQTPQVFRRELLLRAYANASRVTPPITDDCYLVESLGEKVTLVESDASNFKITVAADLAVAAGIIRARPEAKAKTFHPFAEEKMW